MAWIVVSAWKRFRPSAPRDVAYQRIETDEKDLLPAYEDVEVVDVKVEKEVVEEV